MLDVRPWEGELTKLVLRLAVEDDLVAHTVLRQEVRTIEPHRLTPESRFVRDDRFDERFFVAGLLGGDRVDTNADRGRCADIDETEELDNIRLVLICAREMLKHVGNGRDTRLAELL